MSGGSKMKRSAAVRSAVLLAVRSAVLLGALAVGGASAQQADDGLTATQKLGRQVFAQSCGICHLPPQINARTFGPLLSQDTAGGSDEVIRGLISQGTPSMTTGAPTAARSPPRGRRGPPPPRVERPRRNAMQPHQLRVVPPAAATLVSSGVTAPAADHLLSGTVASAAGEKLGGVTVSAKA